MKIDDTNSDLVVFRRESTRALMIYARALGWTHVDLADKYDVTTDLVEDWDAGKTFAPLAIRLDLEKLQTKQGVRS